MNKRWGHEKPDFAVVEMWEKPKDLHRNWMLVILGCLVSGNTTINDLKQFRKPYNHKQSKKQISDNEDSKRYQKATEMRIAK
jgi:hypothetical protein